MNVATRPGTISERDETALARAVRADAEGGGHREKHPFARRVRMRLPRFDGQVHMDRWGFELERIGGVFLHRITAPDPGQDLHDHPWSFVSLILVGGYTEQRALSREAADLACIAERWPETCDRGVIEHRGRWSVKAMRLDECHQIVDLGGRTCWTLVVHGPHRREWGFYLPAGFLSEHTYDLVVRSSRKDMWNETVPV